VERSSCCARGLQGPCRGRRRRRTRARSRGSRPPPGGAYTPPLSILATLGTSSPPSVRPEREVRKMRVSAKMTLGISAVTVLIAGVHGSRQLHQERQDLTDAVEREIRVLGNAIQVSFEHALRDRQFTDIQGALASLEGIAPDLDL